MARRIWTGEHFQGDDVTFFDRFVRTGGVAVVAADVTSWSMRVFESNDDRTGKWIVRDAAPAGYVFDALSTVDWQRDTTGWNFKYRLQPSTFRAEARTYRFEIRLTTASYGVLSSVHSIKFLAMGSV